jgi:hypothetical protein
MDHVTTSFRFAGDWPWWVGVSAAVLLAAGVWPLYLRETHSLTRWMRYLLPALRSATVAMIVVLIAGPVLHHRRVIGELSRLLLFVDGSQSMGLADPSMDVGRKLRIVQQLGMLREGDVKMELPKATEALADARALAGRAGVSQNSESADWNLLLTEFVARITEARDNIKKGGNLEGRAEILQKELLDPATEISRREMRQLDDRKRAASDLSRLAEIATRWQNELAAAFQKTIAQAGPEADAIRTALERFDATSRTQRLQSLLVGGTGKKLLDKLAETNDVQVFSLRDGGATRVWQSGGRNVALPAGLPAPIGEATNLGTPLKTTAAEGETKGQKGAVVLFSDGQHNEGDSPREVARLLGARQWPIYSVGFGGTTQPRDLAVVKIDAPEAVFYEDRVRGIITLKDDMPGGLGFRLAIRDGEKTLWEQDLKTEGRNLRQVPFDFPVGETVKERLKAQRDGVQVSGVPLELKVAVSKVEGDSEPNNNELPLRVRAVTQKRKILLLDGRPRWESRYIRNLFERDEQWEMNAVIAGVTASDKGFAHGDKPEQFPTEANQLNAYDLIVFGDIPRALFKQEEMEWMRDFVGKRGGALIFIDGPRNALREYADSPIGPLIPVEWKAPAIRSNITRLVLPEAEQLLSPFALVPEKAQNAEVWRTLQPPHWLSNAIALPGSEILVEAETPSGRLPAVVLRPFGAGRVLYHAFEDSWRWRYEVADEYHVKYWNQIGNWIAELPFAVRDKFIALDAGAITYRPGESADLRVRLSDGQGRPVTNTVVDAVLFGDGARIATIRLAPDENAGGLFRGRTAALDPGSYEVGIESAAIPERDARARTSFRVEPRETGELTQLSLNEELLRQMSSDSGGQYLREENLTRLTDVLAPLSKGHVIESSTALGQSYWWFVPIIGLLTAEWILRKRAGLI